MNYFERYLGDTYEIVDTLKNSAQSFVATVYDKRARRLCTLKRRELNSLPIYRTLKEIDEVHIPKIYRLFERDEKLIVVEEYIDGQTLEEFLLYRPNDIDEDFAEKILLQLCECLTAIHSRNIIHRDLKPSNIMLTEENFVKVIDFGIARTFKAESSADTEILGTRGYAPPEQFGIFDLGQTNQASDIYSLGVTIKILLGENYDGRLKNILDKCTALKPSDRFQTATELQSAITDKKNYLEKFADYALDGVLSMLDKILYKIDPEYGKDEKPDLSDVDLNDPGFQKFFQEYMKRFKDNKNLERLNKSSNLINKPPKSRKNQIKDAAKNERVLK